MPRATVFKTNQTQAVRLPKAVAFPDEVRQVEVVKVGASRVLTPVGRRWDDFFRDGPKASADFGRVREGRAPDKRDEL
ncbi:MAG: AbrB/MazE/SpoVT family DNA-binding domain-containing protein [Alphaproteobacteria bacterium]|nr:AbrB/MazE/SpoVT family DNA-binding domain-containing protein [Alphaproteobacteria bacterium]